MLRLLLIAHWECLKWERIVKFYGQCTEVILVPLPHGSTDRDGRANLQNSLFGVRKNGHSLLLALIAGVNRYTAEVPYLLK